MKVASLVCGCFALTVLVTLSSGPAFARASSQAARRPVVMMPLPARLLTRCRSAFVLRPVCPRLVPQVSGGFTVSGPVVQSPRAAGFTVFDLEHGAPHETKTWLNRAPAVLHLTLVAGRRPGNLFGGMPYPGSKATATLRNGQSTRTRRRPVLYGTRQWGGHRGSLFLAPVVPVRRPDRRPSHLLVAQGRPRLRHQHPRLGTADGMQQSAAHDHRLDAVKASTAQTARLGQCSGMTPERLRTT